MDTSTRNETARERAWSLMRDLSTFTIEDLMAGADISEDNARHTILALVKADVLEDLGLDGKNGTAGSFKRYRLAKPDYQPRFAGDVKKALAWRQQVWNTIRIKHRATVPEVQTTLTVEVKYATLYRYIRRLTKAGYLAQRGRTGKSGQAMSHQIYVLVRDTGPTAPTRTELLRAIAAKETEHELADQ